ncbi:MAG: MarR family transcriptional regulator [Thermodesulfobacteriota bacterium]
MTLRLSVFPLDKSPGFLLHRTDRQMAAGLQRAFQAQGHELTAEQWGVLSRLWEEEGIHQSELALRSAKDRHNITRILNVLERNGFIRRRPDHRDKRCFNVHLTAAGRALQRQVTPIVLDYLEKCLAGFTEADVEALRRLHERILGNLEGIQVEEEDPRPQDGHGGRGSRHET